MQDQTWIDSQDIEFVNSLNHLIAEFQLSIRQNNLMIQLFNEYGIAMHSIYEATMAIENGDVSNTNFAEQSPAEPPAPANRAERRAQRKTPLDIVAEKTKA